MIEEFPGGNSEHASAPHTGGELTGDELDAILQKADEELLGQVTARSHPEHGLLQMMKALDPPDEDRGPTD